MNLGTFYCSQNRYDEAEVLLLEALSIIEGEGGEKHLRAGYIHNNLGDMYSAQEDYERAELHYLKALDIFQITLTETHPHKEMTLRNYALLLWRKGLYEDSRKYITQAEAHAIKRGSIGPSIAAQTLIVKQEQVEAFFLSCCEFGEQNKEKLTDLWAVYEDWRQRHSKPELLHSYKELIPFLKTRKCVQGRSNQGRWWQGIALRHEYKEISLGYERGDTWRF